MNKTNYPFMNINLRPLRLCLLAALLCSCATPVNTVKNTWKSPDCRQPVGKIAAIAVTDRGLLRQGFENRLVNQLTQAGCSAMPTYDLLSLPQIKADKQAAAASLAGKGAEAVLILRLVDVANTYREVQVDGVRYATTIAAAGSSGWFDFYCVAFTTTSPTYGNLKQVVYLEAILFDLKTEKRLWSALTQTVLTEDMDRAAEMDPLVAMIVAAMQKDGVIR